MRALDYASGRARELDEVAEVAREAQADDLVARVRASHLHILHRWLCAHAHGDLARLRLHVPQLTVLSDEHVMIFFESADHETP